MTRDQITELLGRLSTDPIVTRTLDDFKIRRRPEIEYEPEAVDRRIVEPRDWLVNRRQGIEFGFEDEAVFRNAHPDDAPSGKMLLIQLCLYGNHDGMNRYNRALPFDLSFDDSRESVRNKLAAWEASRRSYVRDTWELPEWTMVAAYADGGLCVDSLLFLLRQPPMPADLDEVAIVPSLDNIISILGKSLSDPELRLILAPLKLDNNLRNVGERWVANFRIHSGIQLDFLESGSSRGASLAQVTLYRENEMAAAEWPGELPFGLTFKDSPEQMFAKIGRPPERHDDSDFTGVAMWFFPLFNLSIRYDTVENVLLMVRLLPPEGELVS